MLNFDQELGIEMNHAWNLFVTVFKLVHFLLSKFKFLSQHWHEIKKGIHALYVFIILSNKK